MARSQMDLLQGTLALLILKALALDEMHGMGISRRIAQITNRTMGANCPRHWERFAGDVGRLVSFCHSYRNNFSRVTGAQGSRAGSHHPYVDLLAEEKWWFGMECGEALRQAWRESDGLASSHPV